MDLLPRGSERPAAGGTYAARGTFVEETGLRPAYVPLHSASLLSSRMSPNEGRAPSLDEAVCVRLSRHGPLERKGEGDSRHGTMSSGASDAGSQPGNMRSRLLWRLESYATVF